MKLVFFKDFHLVFSIENFKDLFKSALNDFFLNGEGGGIREH